MRGGWVELCLLCVFPTVCNLRCERKNLVYFVICLPNIQSPCSGKIHARERLLSSLCLSLYEKCTFALKGKSSSLSFFNEHVLYV